MGNPCLCRKTSFLDRRGHQCVPAAGFSATSQDLDPKVLHLQTERPSGVLSHHVSEKGKWKYTPRAAFLHCVASH